MGVKHHNRGYDIYLHRNITIIYINTSSTKTNIYPEGVAMFSLFIIIVKIINIAKTKYIYKYNIAQNEIHGEILSGLLGRLSRINSKAVSTKTISRIMFY